MNYPKTRTLAFAPVLVLAALAACDGSTPVGEAGAGAGRAELQSVQMGRLVDVYAYRRIDTANGDRRDRFNRRLVRVRTNIAINPNLQAQSLFDAAGNPSATASYEFLPFDKATGHEELVILWDDQDPSEAAKFEVALADAQKGLTELAAAYRGQPSSRPIPIVPRNAAIVLNFSNDLGVDEAFFRANPGAIQLLEFKSDPATVTQPTDLFRILPSRVLPQGNRVIIDTTLQGGESLGTTSTGLPLSSDNVTANIRVSIPSRGSSVSTFYVKDDPVKLLNGSDSSGLEGVIRDFRSGNLADGPAGRLAEPEAPMLVAALGMGITAVDPANREITINKRSNFIPIRGRYPFVDGIVGPNGVPNGPLSVPTVRPLRSGDIITQVVDVNGTPATLRAEVLQNLSLNETGLLNTSVAEDVQGQNLPVARLKVALLNTIFDPTGKPVFFQSSTNPLGRDCTVRARYYESVAFTGALSQNKVSDAAWRHYFVRVEPKPTGAAPNTQVAPNASISVEFTKPMDLDQVDNSANFLITNQSAGIESFTQQMTDPKQATFRVVPTRLSDVSGDGTVLRLQPPLGFFHTATAAELYAMHIRVGSLGVADLAGKPLDVFADPATPIDAWSVDFTLSPASPNNWVGWHSWLFQAEDEDGSVPGSVDMFGQYRLSGGRLLAAAGVRFSRNADNQHLQTIARDTRGECWDLTNNTATLPVPPDLQIPTVPVINGGVHPRLLYWQPRMTDVIAPNNVPQVFEYWQTVQQPVGRVVEPHKPQGSRMQIRYLEDDFDLDYRQPSEFCLDVEQLYWSPFNDEAVLYDVFDRYTLSLAHSKKRPDEKFELFQGACWLFPQSMNSALSLTFAENPLEGTQLTPVLQDKIYRINPNDAFRSGQNVKYVPYPKFDRSYTWRDSRLVTVDNQGNVIGLGGAQEPGAQAPNDDMTANIDSPWIRDGADLAPGALDAFYAAGWSTYVMDDGDFDGDLQRDHDPIALPLLVDVKVFPDTIANGGSAGGYNGFQVALLGPPSNFANPAGPVPGGYYDAQFFYPNRPAWPRVRVGASGGEDLVSGSNVTIDPANQLVAQGSPVKDAGAIIIQPSPAATARALIVAPAGDGMLPWARADFVRKVSTVTFGFFDTLQPQRADFVNESGTVTPQNGFPDILSLPAGDTLRMSEVVVQTDPPQARQPAGTSVVVEMRGADGFDQDTALYDPNANDTVQGRGNLLNPNYACEAYRYSTPNFAGAPRVAATGLTKYVTEDKVTQLRNPATGLLPRFMNLRLVMNNNVTVSPNLSPSLRSMSLVYRLQAPPQ